MHVNAQVTYVMYDVVVCYMKLTGLEDMLMNSGCYSMNFKNLEKHAVHHVFMPMNHIRSSLAGGA